MSNHDRNRNYVGTGTAALAQFITSAELHFADTPRLTRRVTKITDRREIKVIEQKPGHAPATLFSIPPRPGETTRKWSSERTAEIEEIFE